MRPACFALLALLALLALACESPAWRVSCATVPPACCRDGVCVTGREGPGLGSRVPACVEYGSSGEAVRVASDELTCAGELAQCADEGAVPTCIYAPP